MKYLSTVIVPLIALIAMVYTIYQTSRNHRDDLRSKRPYIKLVAPGVKPIPLPENLESPFNQFYGVALDKIMNVGSRPALNLSGKLIMIDQELNEESIHEIDICMANDLPPGGEVGWRNFMIKFNADFLPHFAVVCFTYLDQGLDETLSQIFVMKWEASRRPVPLDFTLATCEESGPLLVKLKGRLPGCL